MKSSSLPCSPRATGFTLVEMMVSIALLSILVLLLLAIMDSTSATVGTSWSHLQSDQDGRQVLDRLQIDLQNMLLRPDIDYEFIQNTGNDKLAFYASAPGYTSVSDGKRVASVVSYQMVAGSTGQPLLERGANDAFQWGGGTSSTPMIFSAAPQLNVQNNTTIGSLESSSLDILTPSVFRFEISFLLKNPTNQSPPHEEPPALVSSLPKNTPIASVAAIIVTLAEIDSQNAKIIPSASWTTLGNALLDANSTTLGEGTSTAQTWNTAIASPTFAGGARIPKKAAAAIRVYDRYFYLNTAP